MLRCKLYLTSYQKISKLKSISMFTNYIKSTLEETRSTICKSCKNIAKYYNWRCIPILVFCPSDKIFLNSSNIYIICFSAKLSYYCLGLYIVEKQVGSILYYLKLPFSYIIKTASSISHGQTYYCF